MRLAEHVIHREIDERDSGRRTDGGPQRIVDQRPDRIGRLRGCREPRQRRHERHVVDLLQGPLPPAQRGRATAEYQQRRLVLLCGSHRAHPVGDARARGEGGDAGHSGHLRPAFGGECGGLLVPGVDQPDVLGAAAVVDGEQVPAGEREDGVDPAGAQSSGDQMSGVDRNWSVDAHGGSIIAAMSNALQTQVLIAGAGPIGVTAAIELARRGIACRIVDPLVEPPQYAKAVGVQPRTLEVFEGMGVLRRILDAAVLMRGQIVYVNGERVAQLDMTVPDDVPFRFIAIPQYATEAILRDELAQHGVQVQRGVRLIGFEQDADGVTATLAGDAGEQRVRADYLIGADGAHSAVRKGLGQTFEGAAFEEQYMLGDVEVDWSVPRGYGIRSMHQTDGKTDDLLVCIPLPGGRGRYRMSMLVPEELSASDTPSCTTSRPCWAGCRPSRRPRATCDGPRSSGSATASSTPMERAGCSSRATPRTSTRRPARRA